MKTFLRTTLFALLTLPVFAVVGCGTDDPEFIPCDVAADCEAGYACNQHPESSIGICAEVCADGCATGYACGGADGTECVAVSQ